jgi:hypothetical protein
MCLNVFILFSPGKPALSWAGFFFYTEPIEAHIRDESISVGKYQGPKLKVEIWAFTGFLFIWATYEYLNKC